MLNPKTIIAGLVVVGSIITGAIMLNNRPLTYSEYKEIIEEFDRQSS